jgi:hypothetical protein
MKKIFVIGVMFLLIIVGLSGCFDDSGKHEDETANLQLQISVLNYQCLVDGPIEVLLSLRNIGTKNISIGEIVIPDTLQFYITTPDGYYVHCNDFFSQDVVDYGILSPDFPLHIEYNISNMTFGNENITINFTTEGIYSIKAIFKDSLESNTDEFKIRKASTLVFTAQQFIDDANINKTDDKLTIDYQSLDYGDTVIVQDNIYDIGYFEDENATQVIFRADEFNLINDSATNLTFDFAGNITDNFKSGDFVKITFHIKWHHSAIKTGSIVEFEYDLEIAEERSDYEPIEGYPLIIGLSSIGMAVYCDIDKIDGEGNFPPERLPESCISLVE